MPTDSTPDKSELLPCPFCGSEKMKYGCPQRAPYHSQEPEHYNVHCECGAAGPDAATADEAIRLFSTRPAADQVPDMVERVARALCVDSGDDPDDLDNSRICKTDGTPLPLWAAYEGAAIAALQAVPAASGEVGDSISKSAVLALLHGSVARWRPYGGSEDYIDGYETGAADACLFLADDIRRGPPYPDRPALKATGEE